MEFTIFYAWQSDRPQNAHRYLIRDATSEALKRIGKGADIEDSPRLDHDTKNVSGTPEIADTIYRKIQESGIFLADLTFVGATEGVGSSRKLLPNPNVALELGYAARSVGWERIICVLNEAFGASEELMFDLRHRRWPICYRLEGQDGEGIRSTGKLLGEQIEIALRSAMTSEHKAVEDATRRLSTETIMFMGWHAHHEIFWNDRAGETILQTAALGFIDHAVDRLLDLKLIDCTFEPELDRYAYRWTYIGKLVLKKLDIKPRPTPEASKVAIADPLKEAKAAFQKMGLRNRLGWALFPDRFPNH